jgi:hypothetical protein
MEAYQERVITEKTELDQRIEKLQAFSGSDKYADVPSEERERLFRQLHVMEQYSGILGERIAAFTAPTTATADPAPVGDPAP